MYKRIFELISTLPEQIWRIFSQRWLLFLFGGITFLFVIGAFGLEQMPTNLQNDPVKMARWMQDISLRYGNLGLMQPIYKADYQIFWARISLSMGQTRI